jgi:hypothetical protein
LKKNKKSTESNKVNLYLADESSETKSLNIYSTMEKMYMRYNAALPSSALFERLFSAGGKNFRQTRKSNGTNTTLLKEKYWTHPCANYSVSV